MTHREAIEAYYRAFRDRDRRTLEAILVPDFRHTSSFGNWNDRDAMLDAIWPEVGRLWAVNLQVFGEGPEYLVRYELDGAPGSSRPGGHLVEYIRFAGDRMAEIEVYLGPGLREP